MKDHGYYDSDPLPLGPPIRTPPPAPAPREIRPGIWQDHDGKLRTEVPPPVGPFECRP